MKTTTATITRNTLSQHAFNLVKSAIVAILDNDRNPNDVNITQLLSLAYDLDTDKTIAAFVELTSDKHTNLRRKVVAYIVQQKAIYDKDAGSDINDNIKIILASILACLPE